jgi:cell division protein FtsQ
VSWSDKGRQLKQKLARVNWYFCTGFLFLCSVLGTVMWGGVQLHDLLNDADALPIEAVAIKGERLYTTDGEIKNALQSLMQNSFFNADVADVQKALESLPWVYHASVRREWPARFKVTLQEQQAVSHWNELSWLNINGEVFDALAHSEHDALPMLSGPKGTENEVLISYRQLDELLKINGFKLTRLRLSPRHAWHAVLANGIEIELGREDKMSRIQRFINVYPTLKQSEKPVATVDLRYDTGFAVGWDDSNKRVDNK